MKIFDGATNTTAVCRFFQGLVMTLCAIVYPAFAMMFNPAMAAPNSGSSTAPSDGSSTAQSTGASIAPSNGSSTAPSADSSTAPSADSSTAPSADSATAPSVDSSTVPTNGSKTEGTGTAGTPQPTVTTDNNKSSEAKSEIKDTNSATDATTNVQHTHSASSNGEKPNPPGFDAAVKLFNDRKYAAAATAFEKFVKDGTDNADVHRYLGVTYQQLKKWDLAIKNYDWVAQNARLISVKTKGRVAAHTLRCYKAGVCPGNCLKLSMPGWAHYPGLDPNLLWMKFTYPGGWKAWSTRHLGEVIDYVNGEPMDKGQCPICHGTGKVPKLQ